METSGSTDYKLSRRMMTKDGWVYFCTQCGDYRPESSFQKQTTFPSRWGLKSSCRIHRRKEGKEPPSKHDDMSYFRLSNVREEDFVAVQELLEGMGYKFGPNEEPVYIQFHKRHPELLYL